MQHLILVNLPPTFINITHFEFITEIQQASGLYFINADAKHLFLFKEFTQNVKSMVMPIDLSEQYDFYLKHEDEIRKIVKLKETIATDVFNQSRRFGSCNQDTALKIWNEPTALVVYAY